jgi:poly[(R)-3-hydroxyalkanoate] polymerase subunit PhaC
MTKPEDPSVPGTALVESYAEAAQRAAKLFAEFLGRQAEEQESMANDEFGIVKAFQEMSAKLLADPAKLATAQLNMMLDYAALWQGTMLKLWGLTPKPVAEPAVGDKRFRSEDWQNNFLFDFIKQSYLIAAHRIHDAVDSVEGLDKDTRRKVGFFTRQAIDAMAPTNFLLTNPDALRETVKSGGQNLVKGFGALLDDLEAGEGSLRIRMTDTKAFKLGENVATTPGKVVFQNDLMQLLQYEPATETVFRKPLLIIPPWINKYYILDLRPKNSFIKWAAEQGHTVFVISWANPDARYAEKTFDDYMAEGPLAALSAIELATGESEIDAIGYCLGGTLLAATLAYLAAKNDARIASATFFASLLDFRGVGDLEVFLDESQIRNLEQRMEKRGYLEGSEMASTFNMLRANDLIWSFVINNYLLGREPFPFDLLYWNSDSTRMPYRMHSFYLRNMYQKNLLKEPGGISLLGTPIDLSKIKVPAYFLSTVEDHIAPWRACYSGSKLFSGPVRFVLGGSGHIAGVINPPVDRKYGYFTNRKKAEDAEAWLQAATKHEGSWWSDWKPWIDKLNPGERVPACKPGDHALKVLEDAPGSYVSLRLDDGASPS